MTKDIPYYNVNDDSSVVRLFIIRHGQTEHNVKKILQGHRDIPINSTGVKQSEQLGAYLKKRNIKFDKIFSSDLIRCQQTTSSFLEFSEQKDVPLKLNSDLRERYMGVIEGMHISDAEHYADKHGKGSFRDFGEDPDSFLARLQKGVQGAAEEAAESGLQNIAIVSHGGAIRTMLKWLAHDGNDYQKVIVFNTSVTIVDYIKDTKQFIVRRVGNTQHLGDGEFIVSDLRLR